MTSEPALTSHCFQVSGEIVLGKLSTVVESVLARTFNPQITISSNLACCLRFYILYSILLSNQVECLETKVRADSYIHVRSIFPKL